MKCEWCEQGLQHLCPNVALTIFGGHHGGFATHVRVNNWQFAFPLPDEIKSEHAGPLMCAGATVFTPIAQYGVRPTDQVAVVGVGGLGHLAVQYLAKWGCDVTAVSSSRDKEEQARELGATHFIATRGTDELRKAARSFDFIFSTVSGDLPWDEYVAALRPQGKLCIIGIPDKPITFGAFGLIGGEKSIVGGQTGSVKRHHRDARIHGPARDQADHRDVCDGRSRPGPGTHPVGQSPIPCRPGGVTRSCPITLTGDTVSSPG